MRRIAMMCLSIATMFAVSCGGEQSDVEVVQGAVTGGPVQLGSASHGGSGGCQPHFNISVLPFAPEHIKEWRIWSGSLVDALQIAYVDNNGNVRVSQKVGGNGGSLQVKLLSGGDFFFQVEGRAAQVNDQICVRSQLFPQPQLCGGGGGGSHWGPDNTLTWPQVPTEYQLGGFKVNYCTLIDNITFYQYAP